MAHRRDTSTPRAGELFPTAGVGNSGRILLAVSVDIRVFGKAFNPVRAYRERYLELTDEIVDRGELINPIVKALAPQLLERVGIGIEVAGQMLVTAGGATPQSISNGSRNLLPPQPRTADHHPEHPTPSKSSLTLRRASTDPPLLSRSRPPILLSVRSSPTISPRSFTTRSPTAALPAPSPPLL